MKVGELLDDLEGDGRDVRAVRIILLRCKSDRELRARMKAYARDFREHIGDARLCGTSPEASKVLETVTTTFCEQQDLGDVFDFPSLGMGLENRDAREERRAERTVDELFRPRRPQPERDAVLDDFFGYRERTKMKP
jgi:hypothetical protein